MNILEIIPVCACRMSVCVRVCAFRVVSTLNEDECDTIERLEAQKGFRMQIV